MRQSISVVIVINSRESRRAESSAPDPAKVVTRRSFVETELARPRLFVCCCCCCCVYMAVEGFLFISNLDGTGRYFLFDLLPARMLPAVSRARQGLLSPPRSNFLRIFSPSLSLCVVFPIWMRMRGGLYVRNKSSFSTAAGNSAARGSSAGKFPFYSPDLSSISPAAQ